MKKWFSALMALILVLALCAGCGKQEEQTPPSGIYYDITGIDPRQAVMTVGGEDISAELYCYWVNYNCSYLEYQLSMYNSYYGLYSQCFNEDGTLNWDAELLEGQTLNQYAKDSALSAIQYYAAIEALAAANGVTLTEENKADIEADRAAAVEEMGGQEGFDAYLAKMGISQDTYDKLAAANYLFEDLTGLIQQEGSPLYLEDADYDQYATYADHILLATVDLSTGAALTEDEIAAKYAAAEDLLAQLQAAGDMEALFAQLADEYSEDTGRATNPNGYIFTPGEMVAVFEDAANALAPGQISGIVESDYGYHIILRKDLAQGLTENPDAKAALAEIHLDTLLKTQVEQAQVETSEVLDSIDPGVFYTDYLAAVEAMEAAGSGESGEAAEGGSSDSSGTETE